MPLAGSGSTLGIALGAVTGPTDPAAAVAWTGIATKLVAYLVENVTILPGTMKASGAVVDGAGTLSVDDGGVEQLAADMAEGAGAKDGREQWLAVAKTILAWVGEHGACDPVGFTALPNGGAVGGVGRIKFDDTALGVELRAEVGAEDAASVPFWTSVGNTILSHIATVTTALPTPVGFTSPTGGGALLGAGSIA